MTTINRPGTALILKRQELSERILALLGGNKDGLTARQIGISIGDPAANQILALLQKSGEIKQKKGFDEENRIVTVYVINRPRA